MVLDGVARKISLVIVIFSVISWIAYVIGFGLRIHEFNKGNEAIADPFHENNFPYWCFTVGPAFLYAAYFFHLCYNVIFTHYLSIFFTAIYFIAAGGVLYLNGMFIALAVNSANSDQYKEDTWASSYYWYIVEFLGAAASTFFYWLSMMFWPCFEKSKNKGYYDYNN